MQNQYFKGYSAEGLSITPLNLEKYIQSIEGNPSRLEFHTDVIERLQRLSGIRRLSINFINEDLEEQTYNLNSLSVYDDGSAIGANIGKKEYRDDSEIRFTSTVLLQSRTADVSIKLNRKEISDRIMARNGRIRSLEDWADEIDVMLKEKILKYGSQNLIKLDLADKLGVAFSYLISGVIYNLTFAPRNLLELGVIIIASDTCYNLLIHKLSKGKHRITIFDGPQYDLAGILALRCSGLGSNLVSVDGKTTPFVQRIKKIVERRRAIKSSMKKYSGLLK